MNLLTLLNNHPALGIVACCTLALLGLFGYLGVRRICLAVERCKGAAPAPKKTRAAEAAPSEPASEAVATKTCARCGRETGVPERHEIYCSQNSDNATELNAALAGLGYKKHEIDKVLPKLDLGAELPMLIKQALAEMPNKSKSGGVS